MTFKTQPLKPASRHCRSRSASTRGLILTLVLALVAGFVGEPARADTSGFPELLAGAEAAEGAPIIIYASRADCRFCRLLEQEVLKPLIRSGDYSGQFNLLPLPLDAPQGLVNFAGKEITVGELASRYQLQLTPTLVFVDDQGSELVPRLIGYQSGAYYEYYLEQAIRAAGTGTKPSAQALEDAGR